jgi:hypothetical protein
MRKFFKTKDSQKEKGKANSDASSGPPPSGDGLINTVGGLSLSDSHDQEETKQRFVKASQTLEEALRVWKSWKYAESGITEFPELAGEPERFDDEFRKKLEKIMNTRKAALDDKSIWATSSVHYQPSHGRAISMHVVFWGPIKPSSKPPQTIWYAGNMARLNYRTHG